MHTLTEREHKARRIAFKALVGGDRDFLRELIRTTLQEVLEAEMTEALGAAKSERTMGRNGYRSGYYGRSLITRVGKLELRVPQDRSGQFSHAGGFNLGLVMRHLIGSGTPRGLQDRLASVVAALLVFLGAPRRWLAAISP